MSARRVMEPVIAATELAYITRRPVAIASGVPCDTMSSVMPCSCKEADSSWNEQGKPSHLERVQRCAVTRFAKGLAQANSMPRPHDGVVHYDRKEHVLDER
ncbi:hypothetical protein GCM10022380_05060 [Amycolatopsis tucumanensis]|uniref:Uncharacterized protein n=1 Tax=Amycolatopsis tucumanensis TaxID=401106 RepID=A0ABP7HD72_9PSEU